MKGVLGATWGVGGLGVLLVGSADDVVALELPCPYPGYGPISVMAREKSRRGVQEGVWHIPKAGTNKKSLPLG